MDGSMLKKFRGLGAVPCRKGRTRADSLPCQSHATTHQRMTMFLFQDTVLNLQSRYRNRIKHEFVLWTHHRHRSRSPNATVDFQVERGCYDREKVEIFGVPLLEEYINTSILDQNIRSLLPRSALKILQRNIPKDYLDHPVPRTPRYKTSLPTIINQQELIRYSLINTPITSISNLRLNLQQNSQPPYSSCTPTDAVVIEKRVTIDHPWVLSNIQVFIPDRGSSAKKSISFGFFDENPNPVLRTRCSREVAASQSITSDQYFSCRNNNASFSYREGAINLTRTWQDSSVGPPGMDIVTAFGWAPVHLKTKRVPGGKIQYMNELEVPITSLIA
ncbi:hypothetical protein M501DRAFT_217945 [Patellaria atrata CBS 101060]|uniref:Uncharacterized protein n=1 Tax=Patellaria atrata CBS 101060 TaxID=1346257 RepID=A0A9P4VP98_9PEZI|nr:hypothetical protein M501DRAFT_217945 [Patellaria atrata CBS 101060]